MIKINQWDLAREHPLWDAKHLRVILTKEGIEALPVETIRNELWREKMCGVFWNGREWYPAELTLQEGEVGYDEKARYIVKP